MASDGVKKFRHYDPAIIRLEDAYQLARETSADQSVLDTLREAMDLVNRRETFALDSTSEPTDECQNIVRTTKSTNWAKLKEDGKTSGMLAPRMMTGPLEGQLLKTLISIQKAKRVLDVGMYTGYSALSMAEALPADGEVVSVDMNDFLEKFTGDLLSQSPHGNKIKIRIGNAVEVMQSLAAAGEKFDIIFLDAGKGEYVKYVEVAFDEGLLAPNGTVLVDNTFFHGRPYNPACANEDNPLKRFAEAMKQRPDLHRCMVPVRDGLVILRRTSDVEGTAKQSE